MRTSAMNFSSKRGPLLALGAFLTVVTPLDAFAAPCTRDTECPGDQICEKGQCATPRDPNACAKDTDCSGDRVCAAGRCTAPPPAPTSAPRLAACAKDTDCKGDRICDRGQCTSPVTQAVPGLAPVVPGGPSSAGVVSVSIEAPRGDIASLESNGRTAECAAPCKLEAQPGAYTLRVSGSKTFEQPIEVPVRPAATLRIRHACTACYVAGAVLLGVAVPFIAGGGALGSSSRTEGSGLMLGIVGANFAVTGIVFLIVGAAHGGTKAEVDARGTVVDSPALGRWVTASEGLGVSF
ncbi:MAG: hypothetical protein JST00_32825 [Deltaproteobacteria bacterium]|nr:hypothetical protein [Deltaproteobacteria bacterium]